MFLVYFAFGLAVGSFINCLVYRLNNDLSPLRGRSLCPRCRHKLAWFDNIPLLSFFLLRGKCRYCHSPISWQYPLVELATGILTLLIFNFPAQPAGGQFSIFNLLITYALIAIFVSDLLYTTIPDEVIYPAIGISFLISLYPHILISNLLSSLAAAGLFYLLVLITKNKGMGIGDVKLAALMGLILGWPKITIALYFAFLTGAVVGVILILLRKKRFGQTIAFGPFLTTGSFLVLIYGDKIEKIISRLGIYFS